MIKRLTISIGLLFLLAIVVWQWSGASQSPDQIDGSVSDSQTFAGASSTPNLISVRQYQSEGEEVLTVHEYDTEVYVVGAGLDRATLPKVPNSPTAYFANERFSLSLGDNNVRVWREQIPYYEGIETYDEASWELVIPATCQRYYDGCNTCASDSGCTEMFCTTYEQPQCLDGAIHEDGSEDGDVSVSSNDEITQ